MYLENVGVVIIDSEKKASAQLVSAAEWTKVDEEVAAIVNAKDAEVKAELGKAFATTEVKLNGERDPGNRTEETNLGDFAADAILWGARQALGEDQVDVALTNGGGIRASIEAGDITMDDMKTVFPFGNEVATIEVTGAELLEALEAATFSTPTAIGAFPQVAGMSFTIDTSVPYENGPAYESSTYFSPANPGARVKNVTVNGEALDLEAAYTLATNDFTAAGGDTYGVFAGKSIYMTGVALEDALVNYTRDVLGNVVTAEKYGKPAGRITVIVPVGAAPTNDTLTANEAVQNPTVYKIDDFNYFQLRDLAAILNGTEKQFSVDYNEETGAVNTATGKSYEATGEELKGPAKGEDKSAAPSNDVIYVDGDAVELEVYKIDGTNYFKLRDLGKTFDFYVGYDSENDSMFIDTSKPYAE